MDGAVRGAGMADDAARMAQLEAEVQALRAENTSLRAENGDLRGDLSEALEQETATAEILRVIAESPTDAQPVLDTLLQSAVRLSHSARALLLLRDGDQVEYVAVYGVGEKDYS